MSLHPSDSEDLLCRVCPFGVKRRPSGAADLGLFIPQQRTSEDCRSTSEKCHKLTHAPQQRPALFDHFVDDRVYPWRYPDALAPKHTREASGRSGNRSRQVRTFRDVFLITELLDSKAESDDVGLERSWLGCPVRSSGLSGLLRSSKKPPPIHQTEARLIRRYSGYLGRGRTHAAKAH